jgi:hypothetical protein
MLGGTVAIASGLEEAVDGWVSANYILGTTTAGNAQESMGTMDLGGASIQVPEALSAVLMPGALSAVLMPPVLSASLLPMCVGGREYETCDAIYKTPHPIDKRVHAACGMRHAGFDNGIRQGVDTSFRSFIDVSGL